MDNLEPVRKLVRAIDSLEHTAIVHCGDEKCTNFIVEQWELVATCDLRDTVRSWLAEQDNISKSSNGCQQAGEEKRYINAATRLMDAEENLECTPVASSEFPAVQKEYDEAKAAFEEAHEQP